MTFDKKLDEFQITYDFKSNLNLEVTEALLADLNEELAKSPEINAIVFNLQAHDLDPKAFKLLTPFGLALIKKNQQMYVLAENKSVHSIIRQEGVDRILKSISSLAEVTAGPVAPKSPHKLDVSFVNPFIDGTLHVLNVQCKTKATPQKPVLKASGLFKGKTDIAGIIGITSKSFQGSIAICFPESIYLALMSQMLGEEVNEINDETKDGAAEMANMIFGYAKKILNENGHTIDKALPSVIRGPDIKIDHVGSQDSIILPFSVGEECFFMEIGTEKN